MLLPVVKVNYFFARKIFFSFQPKSAVRLPQIALSPCPQSNFFRWWSWVPSNPQGACQGGCMSDGDACARLSHELCDYASSFLVQIAQTK